MGDQIEIDRTNQKRLPNIEANLQSISEEARNHHASNADLIRQEVRALGKIIGNKDKSVLRKTPELRSDK